MKKRYSFNRLSVKIFVYCFVIAIIVIGIITYVAQQEIEKVLLLQERVMSRVGADSIERRSVVNYQKLQIAVSQIVYNEAIIQAFAKRDREEIARLTSPAMEGLLAANIEVFNFYLPDNQLFFQVSKQKNQAENPSAHEAVIEVNQKLLPIKGLVYGWSGLAFTYIMPVLYKDTHVGAVELGLPFGSRLLNIFKRISGGEWFIYSLEDEKNVLLSTTSDKDLPVNLPGENRQDLSHGENVFLNKTPYLLEAVPLKDYANKVRWYVTRISDNSQAIQMAARQRNRNIAFGILITSLGFSTIFFVMLHLLKPLGYLVEKAQSFACGD